MPRASLRILAAPFLCAILAAPLHAQGVWSELKPLFSPRTQPGIVYDPVGDRFIGCGGLGSVLDTLTYACPASQPGNWSVLATSGPRPGYPKNTTVYDPVRHRVLCFGAADGGSGSFPGIFQLTLGGTPTWSEVAASGAPPPLSEHSMVYDPVRDRLLIFGGTDGTGLKNKVRIVWLASGAVWDSLTTAGTPPSGRIYTSVVYDPSGDRLIVFGGQSSSGYKNDTWELTLSGTPTWTQLAPTGTLPGIRRKLAYGYDAANDRLVIQGGQPTSTGALSDTWALSLGASPAWTRIATSQAGPSARSGHTGAYDSSRGRMALWGGRDTEDLEECNTLSLAAGAEKWLEFEDNAAHPRKRGYPIAALDTQRSRWIVADPTTFWSLSLGDQPRWTQLFPSGAGPTAVGSSMIYDPGQDRLVLFGVGTSQVWELSFANGSQWTSLAPAGGPSTYRRAVLDPARPRLLMYGGDGSLWALSLSGPPVWSPIQLTAPPCPCASFPAEQAIIVDPVLDRLILTGAYNATAGIDADSVRAISLAPINSSWTSLHAVNGPRFSATRSVAYDTRRQRILEFGGYGYTGSGVGRGTFGGTAKLQLGPFPQWGGVATAGGPGSRHAAALEYDASHDRLLLFGGAFVDNHDFSQTDVLLMDTWIFDMSTVAGADDGAASASGQFALRVTPNPVVRAATLRFTLRARAFGSLEVVDLAGRLIARRDLSALLPGTHALTLDEFGALPAGIYFARVTSGGEVASARVCKLR